ncbi:MAG TPA: hypothetical protein VF393_00410, partial [archaeon]
MRYDSIDATHVGKKSALPRHLRVVVAMAVEMAPAMAVEMAAAVVMVVVVALLWTPSICLNIEDDVANALSRLVKQFFDSLYLGIVKVTVVRKNGTGERCNSFADSGK